MEYLLKSGISLTVLYFFYWLILRNATHFNRTRIVLMSSLLLSLIIPLFNLKIPSNIETSMPRLIVTFDETIITAHNIKHTLDIWQVMTLVYFIGMLIVFARLIYQAIYLHAISKLSRTIRKNGLTLVLMNNEFSPFSYFNKIYIPASKTDDYSIQSIIEHENSHKKQCHYVDLFIIEVITIFQWYNPIVWLYERSIKEVHEFLADEAVLSNGYNQGKYQALLVNEAIGGPVFILTNQFNQSIIKKRILMMKKMKTTRLAGLKTLLFVPLVAVLLMTFANSKIVSQVSAGENEHIISGKVTEKTNGKSLCEIHVNIESTTIGTTTDADGSYSLRVPDDKASSLVFSGAGLRTEHRAIGSNKVIDVQMENNVISMAFEKEGTENTSKESRSNTQNAVTDVDVETEINPTYPGGMDALKKYLIATIQYPEKAKEKGIEGKVYVQFTVTKEGKVTDPVIKRGVNEILDQEAIRVVNSFGNWKPGIQEGKAVDAQITLPIEFKLQ